MNHSELIDAAKAALEPLEAVRGLFVGGSLGRSAGDEWSDVDLVAVAQPDQQRWLADQWRSLFEQITPVVFWNELHRDGLILNAVTHEWLRCDLVLTDPTRFRGRAQNLLQPLIDRDGLYGALPASLPEKTPNAGRVYYLINEFIRVLGLTPVVLARGEYVTGVMGTGLLRDMVQGLFMEEVSLPDAGGILHLSTLLTPEQMSILCSLPYPAPSRNEVLHASIGVTKVFLPLARGMAGRLGVVWPSAFEAATRRHLIDTLGDEVDLSWWMAS
ncbi:hypothetical protein [Devosia sp. RR2S18]|uniref:hypothetical protein n=1 Tax=Devosia rhizosphaerae TaxID=3049774 RepID=UPI00254116CD|nr:hypothetical protein [Devosia sp. RR2S18]WIJ26519.1 hypothetical protein QOV41_07105 [Devosia sp. RR2S18]